MLLEFFSPDLMIPDNHAARNLMHSYVCLIWTRYRKIPREPFSPQISFILTPTCYDNENKNAPFCSSICVFAKLALVFCFSEIGIFPKIGVCMIGAKNASFGMRFPTGTRVHGTWLLDMEYILHMYFVAREKPPPCRHKTIESGHYCRGVDPERPEVSPCRKDFLPGELFLMFLLSQSIAVGWPEVVWFACLYSVWFIV